MLGGAKHVGGGARMKLGGAHPPAPPPENPPVLITLRQFTQFKLSGQYYC